MKIFKKVLKALFILMVIAAWLNIGYYGGKSWSDGSIKLFKNEPLNNFQKFQRSPKFTADTHKEISAHVICGVKADKIISIFLWPIGLAATLILWVLYGITQAVIGIWLGLVFLSAFLFKFFFCGGFFKLLGNLSYRWILRILTIIVFLIFAFQSRRIYKRMKRL